jgi:mRNA interferase MazF
VLADWGAAGLNVSTAVKRGLYTVHHDLVVKVVGALTQSDGAQVEKSLRTWLDL